MPTKKPRVLLAAGLASAVLASMSGGVLAADTQAAWVGTAVITASTGCSSVAGTSVGDIHVSSYRPKINGPDTLSFLSIISTAGAVTFKNNSETTVHQMRGAGTYAATAINKRARTLTNTGSYSFTITPNPVTVATPVVTIDGTINDYFTVVGCNITFQGAYVPLD